MKSRCQGISREEMCDMLRDRLIQTFLPQERLNLFIDLAGDVVIALGAGVDVAGDGVISALRLP